MSKIGRTLRDGTRLLWIFQAVAMAEYFCGPRNSITTALRYGKCQWVFKETSFSKATMLIRFPVKKNAGCPKAPHDFPPRKDGILYPPPPVGLSWDSPPPPAESVRTEGWTDGHVTITSQPKFLGSIGYQICLAMELRWRAGSAIFLVC